MTSQTENKSEPTILPRRWSSPMSSGRRMGNRQAPASPMIFTRYLMNDIPRGIDRTKLIDYLLLPPHTQPTASPSESPQLRARCGLVLANSRLDDELSVATIEFTDTPQWLQDLNNDPNGFPKKTAFGTIWRGINTRTGEPDAGGQTEFNRAAMEGHLLFAEMLAEFTDTDVNVQDSQGRTALHWACANGHTDVVRLCLSILETQVGLRDQDGLTAFDIARWNEHKSEAIPGLFYRSMFELEEEYPQEALLRVLTVTSEPARAVDQPLFPGEAIFGPIHDQNVPLVSALVNRRIDLTSRNQDGYTALHVAAAVGNTEIATTLLEGGSEVNAVDDTGATALHHAARTGQDMVLVLLDWKADITAKDNNERSVLHWAAENGQLEAARVVLDRGLRAHVREKDKDGRTALQVAEQNDQANLVGLLAGMTETDVLPILELMSGENRTGEVVALMKGEKVDWPLQSKIELKNGQGLSALLHAAMIGDTENVVLLLELGADVYALGPEGQTVLQLAARGGYTEVVKVLLAAGADIHAAAMMWKQTALHLATKNGHTETVQVLLAGGADVEARAMRWKQTALQIAAENGHTETVKALLAGGAAIEAVDDASCTALHWASDNRHIETVKVILTWGGDIEATDMKNRTALHTASSNGYTEVVNVLLAGGAEIESRAMRWKQTALQIAAENGHTETVKALLASGADIGAVDYVNWTALHWASYKGHIETVKALLAGGADIEAGDVKKRTALHTAAGHGYTTIVKILLAGGANIEAVDVKRGTALHAAASNGDTEIVQVLLAGGADIEVAGVKNQAALHQAVYNGHIKTIKALLTGGAQINAWSDDGTALQLAYKIGKIQIAEILLAAGASKVGRRVVPTTAWGIQAATTF